jgi:hypothetical protein
MSRHILSIVIPADARGAFLRGFGLSLFFGLFIIFVVGPATGVSSSFGGEGHDGYWEIAWNVARGNGFVFEPGGPPELHRPPVAPLLLAPLTLLPASSQQAALVLLNSLLIGAICYFLFDLASRISGSQAAGIAVGILLLYPWLYWHAKNPMNIISQTLGVVFLLDLIASGFLRSDRPAISVYPFDCTVGRLVLTGVAAAVLALTHGTALLAIVFLLLLVLIAGIVKGNRHWILAAIIPGVVAMVCIAPWTYRNWKVTHRFVPIVHSAGFAYFLGSAHWGFGSDGKGLSAGDNFKGVFVAAHLPDASSTVRYCGVTDVTVANELGNAMVKDMKSYPGKLFTKTFLNALEFYFPIVYSVSKGHFLSPKTIASAMESLALSIVHFLLWGLAIVGIWTTKDKIVRRSQLLVLLSIGLLCIPYFPVIAFIGHAQYAAPIVPLLAILAASGVLALGGSRQAPSERV